MNKSKKLLLPAAVLVLITTVHAAHAQSTQLQPGSAKSSPPSATPASDRSHADPKPFINACRAAVAELEAARVLIAASEAETASLLDRLETEKRLARVLDELAATQRSESQALRTALTADAEATAAKNTVIASQERLITELRNKRPSPWRRLGDILLGAATVLVLK